MKSAEDFLSSDHHLSLSINHCNFGTFREVLASHDINPANRLYLIPPVSDITNSYIGQRGCPVGRIPLKPGRIYFIPGGYDLEYCFDRELRIVAIHFFLEPFAGFDLFHGEEEIRRKHDGEGLAPALMDELGTDRTLAGALRLRGYFSRAVALFAGERQERAVRMARLEERYGRLFDWIAAHVRAGVTVEEVALGAGISRESLARRFPADMGMTLKAYMNRRLAREIGTRLVSGGDNLKTIAQDLGFRDEYYFSRFFKRQTGLPPGEYRRRYGS